MIVPMHKVFVLSRKADAQALLDGPCQPLIDATKFVFVYTGSVWLILFFAQNWIVRIFGATGDTALFVHYFCTWIAPTGIFMGFLFISNG